VLPGRQQEDEAEDAVDGQAQQGQEGAPEPADTVAVADVHPDDVHEADEQDDAEDEEPGVAGKLVPAQGEPLRDAAEDELADVGGVIVVHGSVALLVPKLCLGTQVWEALLPVWYCPRSGASRPCVPKRSLGTRVTGRAFPSGAWERESLHAASVTG